MNEKMSSFCDSLQKIYASMDKQYNKSAKYYDFFCKGCVETCCLTRFYHHTNIEYNYFINGLCQLDPILLKEIKERAKKVCDKYYEADKKNEAVKVMCPVNIDGLCALYEYRPMICRLHGVPHEFRRPDGKIIYGECCYAMKKQFNEKGYFRFDRTDFYIELAKLESEFRKAFGVKDKFKKTVAEIILFA